MKRIGFFLFFLFFFSLSVGFSQDKELMEWRKLYKTGIRALADQDLIEAEKAFRSLISIPNDGKKSLKKYQSKAFYFLGDVYFIRKQYQKALSYYRIVVGKYYSESIYSKTLYKMGRTLILNKEYSKGIALLNDYLARFDNHDGLADNALYWLGRAYLGLKDYQLSLQTFRLLLDKYPDSALAYDVRQTLGGLRELIEKENRKQLMIDSVTNQLIRLKKSNERLQQEKLLLEKASRLLVIKQKLLQLKNLKLEELNRIKAQKVQKEREE